MGAGRSVNVVARQSRRHLSRLSEPRTQAIERGQRIVLRRSYRWPHPAIFVAGMPKSGTTWTAQLLARVPGYRQRPLSDPDGCTANHDVCRQVFSELPRDLFSVVKLHTRCTPENLAVIDHFQLPTVVMFRDLRDQCVSRYYHVLTDPTHRHHELYRSVSKDEGLAHCVEVTLDAYVPWIEGWLPVLAERPERFHELRYEDLRAHPASCLERVLAHYGIDLGPNGAVEIVAAQAEVATFGLDTKLLLAGKSTARKGEVGSWRTELSTDHVRRLGESCGELLIRLGYERDLSWIG